MTRADRVWHHEMETCEGISEHAERIASLEELVLDPYVRVLNAYDPKEVDDLYARMAALGIKEDE